MILTCPSEGSPLSRAWASPSCWRRSVPCEVDVQEVFPLYPVEPWQQTTNKRTQFIILLSVCQYSTFVSIFLKFLTFQWADWWSAQDIVRSQAHLVMGCQEHPQVLMTQSLAAPQSEGARASSWPTPRWFESPGHLLHLGGTTGKLNCQSSKRKDGSWSAASLSHVGHQHQMIMPLCTAWAGSVWGGWMWELCDSLSEGRTTLWIMWGVYVIKRGHAKNITIKCVHLNSHTLCRLLVNNEYTTCVRKESELLHFNHSRKHSLGSHCIKNLICMEFKWAVVRILVVLNNWLKYYQNRNVAKLQVLQLFDKSSQNIPL